MRNTVLRVTILMVVCALMFSTIAFAAYGPDLTAKCTIEIAYRYDDEPVIGAEFQFYPVGDITKVGKNYILSLSGEYVDYPVEVDGLDDVQFQKAADTLAGYVGLDGHKPMATLTTDAKGNAKLVNLDAGLYLMMGTPLHTEEGVYKVENQLIILPFAENTAGEWEYELTVKPKAEFEYEKSEPLEILVAKVWNDKASGEIHRPTSITVHLLRDGEKFDTVVLDEETNWRHEWVGLDRAYNWSVAEDVPEKYTVSINLQGTQFIITNTCKEPPPTPNPSPTPPPTIPQTGQLWWPIPVLFLTGVALIAVGFALGKEDEDA